MVPTGNIPNPVDQKVCIFQAFLLLFQWFHLLSKYLFSCCFPSPLRQRFMLYALPCGSALFTSNSGPASAYPSRRRASSSSRHPRTTRAMPPEPRIFSRNADCSGESRPSGDLTSTAKNLPSGRQPRISALPFLPKLSQRYSQLLCDLRASKVNLLFKNI